MGRRRRDSNDGVRGGGEELHVNVPSFFRCPISLDVMNSPVSLCTGVTYDRSSIQAWLDGGHNTCPATMQILPSKDFVPNHTLHRLIQLWCSRQPPPHDSTPAGRNAAAHFPDGGGNTITARDLLADLHSSSDFLPLLRKIADFAAESEERIPELAADDAGCVPVLNGLLLSKDMELEALEVAVRVLSLVLAEREDGAGVDGSLADPRTVSSLLAVLKQGCLDSRIAAARVVESIASVGAESKLLVAETEGILPELLRLVSDGEGTGKAGDPRAVDAGLSCLVAVSSPRRVRQQIVRLGVVPILGTLLERPSTASAAAEKALKLMETASTCTEGRAAICEDPGCVAAIVGRMMKGGGAATEHAVVVLWSVCHLFGDRRAQEAVAGSNGLSKILLLMQSNCSPAVRQMSGDLLKIFRVNSKSCLPSYDSKTTHIMPF